MYVYYIMYMYVMYMYSMYVCIYLCMFVCMGVDLKVHVGIVSYKGRQCYNIRKRESLFLWVRESNSLFGERNGEHLSWWGGIKRLNLFFS